MFARRPVILTAQGVLALARALPEAERLALGRDLLTTTTDPALFADLSVAARDIEAAALRLSRIGFEQEC